MLGICHTHYSLQTGIGSPEAWAQAAAERGYTSLAVADVNGLYGAVEFCRAVSSAGLRPVVGAWLELDRRTSSGCVMLVESAAGYRTCCRLLTRRHLSSEFCFAEAAEQCGLDGVLFLARSPAVLQELSRTVFPENLYALSPIGPGYGVSTGRLWDTLEPRVRRAFVPESWFLREEDREAFGLLSRLRGMSGRSGEAIPTAYPGAVLPAAAAWQSLYPEQRVAAEIEERCRFVPSFGRALLPRIALPPGTGAPDFLRTLCLEGLTRNYAPARQAAAQARLDRELEVIIGNGFADYFLYVNEIIRFAHAHDIPTGVRGSAASCLVSYVLGFTDCCPLEYDLYFERFMNPGRKDCPDIDIDIADNRRDEVIDFCYRRWGRDHVAMVATVQFYRTRGALRDAGRLLRMPPETVTRILDDRDAGAECPELFRVAGRLVGRPRHLGIHCGGLLITPCPITDVTPLARATKGILISHYEKDQAEAIGLVKMDLLGNSALSVIEEAKQWLAARGQSLAEPGPVYDYKVNRLFAAGDTLGVYQCESPGMRQLCRALGPATRKEVAAALSLIRPGPAAAGMKDVFIKRRRRLEPVRYIHPKMADFLAPTYGVMLYQEDVMKVAVNLAGYTMADADVLRRAVSKSRTAATFADEKHRFVFTRARAAGIPVEKAEEIWNSVTRFASYSYCKAHATVYARLAWLMARLKVHYPREFFTAVLNCHKSMYPMRVFVWDALRHGIPVHGPDVNRSEIRWTPIPNGVLAGLGIIRGMTRKTLDALIRARAEAPFRDLRDLLARVRFQAGEAERLILTGACRDFGTRGGLLAEFRMVGRSGGQLTLWEGPPEPVPPQVVSQLILTGIPFCMHPVEPWTGGGVCSAASMAGMVDATVDMTGILDAVKILHTKADHPEDVKEMSFVTLEDATGLFDVVLFPDSHRKYGSLFNHVGPYRVRGRVISQWDSFSLELEHAELVTRSA